MNVKGERRDADSPCVGVCSATALGDPICVGCGRTQEQVIKWNVLSDDEKRQINRQIRGPHGRRLLSSLRVRLCANCGKEEPL